MTCRIVQFLVAALWLGCGTAVAATPNLVWIVVDDMSPDFSCYGQRLIATPHVDRLAATGTRFTRSYTTAPVCSPSRSALITGMAQTAIGGHHHRSGRGRLAIHLPPPVRPLPALFREAGYYTCIGDGVPSPDADGQRLGKTDYNFVWDPAIYDGADWSGRRAGQPFFMQVMLPGGKLRDGKPGQADDVRRRAAAVFGAATDPDAIELPPYLPRDPALLADQAAYLDAVRLTDRAVGDVLARLEREGLLGETLVVFLTDHGISHARAKQFLYDSGTHVPLVISGPGIPAAAVREDLVPLIDVAATSLAAAGIAVPEWMQGRDLFAVDFTPRRQVFAARDRCDETVDRIRSVRDDRYLLIRNGHPRRPLLQPNAYKDAKPTLRALRDLHAAGQLDPLAERILFAAERPAEELYRYRDDPWQIENLVDDPTHATALADLRLALDGWMAANGDVQPEPEAMYDSDMEVYVGKGNPEVEKNIALMKEWARAGR